MARYFKPTLLNISILDIGMLNLKYPDEPKLFANPDPDHYGMLTKSLPSCLSCNRKIEKLPCETLRTHCKLTFYWVSARIWAMGKLGLLLLLALCGVLGDPRRSSRIRNPKIWAPNPAETQAAKPDSYSAPEHRFNGKKGKSTNERI